MTNVTKCRHADNYKGIRKPKCDCFVCQTKWTIAELTRELLLTQKELKSVTSSTNSAHSASQAALYVANK